MRSLLSKAGQAHRCGCRACSTVVSGFGRRVTAAPRRKATFAEVFTACYSSVFASAAIIDAVRKEERRQDLDRQLEQVRTELAELKSQPEHDDGDILSRLSWLRDSQMETLWDSMKEILVSRPYMKEIYHPIYPSVSHLRRTVQETHYNTIDSKARHKARTTADTEFLAFLERAMRFEENEPSISRRGPKDHKHLYWFSKRMERMVEDLMSERRVRGLSHDMRRSPSFEEAQELLKQGFPRYKLASVDLDAARENSITLNEANRAAIADGALSFKERVGRVCYNLLMSAYPPDMHSLNTLIVAFARIPGLRPLNRHVIDTFFYGTYLMPTPTTYPAILHHLGGKQYKGDFLSCMSRMVGLDGDVGAKVRKRHIDDVKGDRHLQAWALETGMRTWTGDYVFDHASLNALTVDRILNFFLSAQMNDAAMLFLGSCVRSGVKLTSWVVKEVIDQCLCVLDWLGGVRLIRLLVQDTDKWSSMLESYDKASAAYLIDRFYSILDMVGLDITNGPISDARLTGLGLTRLELSQLADWIAWTNDSLPSAVAVEPQRGGKGLSKSSRRSRSRLLQLESLEKECMRVWSTTMSIERKLTNPKYQRLPFCISTIQHIGQQTLENGRRLVRETEKTLKPFTLSEDWHHSWKLCQNLREPKAACREKQSAPQELRPKKGLMVSVATSAQMRAPHDEPQGRDAWAAPESWWEPSRFPSYPQPLGRLGEERDTIA